MNTTDYDGDKLSQNGILSKEAIEETKEQLASPLNLISPSGKFLDTLNTETVKYVVHALTRIPEGTKIPEIED